jgi:CRP-like cAMP-binding protein
VKQENEISDSSKTQSSSPAGSIFQTLRELPFLSGVSTARIQEMVGSMPFHFMKFQPGDVIAAEGEPCTHLKIIISGTVRLTITSSNGQVSVEQTIGANSALAPDYLFGRRTTYPGSARAITQVSAVQIAKADYRKMLSSDSVFLFNYLNTVSTNAQKGIGGIMAIAGASLAERLALWVETLTHTQSTNIVIRSKHRDLAAAMGVTRSTFNTAVERMEADGLIELRDVHELRIIDRAALLAKINL